VTSSGDDNAAGPHRARPRALVTGASRGIGQAVAIRLAEQGYSVTVSARNPEVLHDLAGELNARGHSAHWHAADMGRTADLDRLAAFQTGLDPRLDLLVLSAGVGTAARLGQYAARRAERAISVNYLAPFQLIQALLPALRAAAQVNPLRSARIIAMASLAGVVAEPGLAAYGASKAALISLCESVNVDEAGSGVTATAISPGYVDTEMSAWTRDKIPPEEMIRAGDIAELVLALSRLSRYAAIPNIVLTRPGAQLWRA
jgi:3-oxoacyl-[acyl-carrier protein] reductase